MLISDQQCVSYQSPYSITPGAYPIIWQVPGNEVFSTPEFKQVNSSINWSMVPNIAPRKMVNGSFDTSTYPPTDPDCWWSFSSCTMPNSATGLKPDYSICPEPDSNDWQMEPAGKKTPAEIDAIFEDFVKMGKNGTFSNSGAICLQHELNNGTMSKAQQWFPSIKSAYKHVIPAAICLNITHPYAETNYTFPSFAEYIDTLSNSSSPTNHSPSGSNKT
ncbi:19548_t:CDS:2, partial [Racocetra fulgida]